MSFSKASTLVLLVGIYCAGMYLIMASKSNNPNTSFQLEATGKPFAVVELFTSEGCSSCPPAEALLNKLVEENAENIYPLAFHVDYWDRLGWKDVFSNPAFSQRQRGYALSLKSGVYTPQIVINGISEAVGSDEYEVRSKIMRALSNDAKLQIQATPAFNKKRNLITIDYSISDFKKDLMLNVALVERGIVRDIHRGENRGRRLSHENVVRAYSSEKLYGLEGSAKIKVPSDLNWKESSVIIYAQDLISLEIFGATAYDFVQAESESESLSHQK